MSNLNKTFSLSGRLNPGKTRTADPPQRSTTTEKMMWTGPDVLGQDLSKKSRGQMDPQGVDQSHMRGSVNIETGLVQGLLCTEDRTNTDTAHVPKTESTTDLHHETRSREGLGQGAQRVDQEKRRETNGKNLKTVAPHQERGKNHQPRPYHPLLQSESPVQERGKNHQPRPDHPLLQSESPVLLCCQQGLQMKTLTGMIQYLKVSPRLMKAWAERKHTKTKLQEEARLLRPLKRVGGEKKSQPSIPEKQQRMLSWMHGGGFWPGNLQKKDPDLPWNRSNVDWGKCHLTNCSWESNSYFLLNLCGFFN